MGRTATPYAVVPRRGKLTRKCERCGAQPGTRCWKMRTATEADGTSRVPLERQTKPHDER